jgi:hypothetical protein
MTQETRTGLAYARAPQMRRFTFVDTEHQAHWKRVDKGTAQMEVTTHTGRPYLSFDAVEKAGNGVTKRTMLTLDPKLAREFYEWLKTIYEPQAGELLQALKRWQRFARDNGWTDADYHDANGMGWISAMDDAIAKAENNNSP